MSDPIPFLLPCLCCGALTIGERDTYEICLVCRWEDDPVQAEDHEYGGGANELSLSEARAQWLAGKLRR